MNSTLGAALFLLTRTLGVPGRPPCPRVLISTLLSGSPILRSRVSIKHTSHRFSFDTTPINALLDELCERSVAESCGRLQTSKNLSMEFWMMNFLKQFEVEVSAWLNISAHPHRFGGRKFLFGSAEVGHIHAGGIVDIPFPRSVRDALLAEGLAEGHRWVPNSGWITFRVRSEEDLSHALWLMRLSYIRYALKTATDPRALLEQEAEELHLNPQFKFLLDKFVPATATRAATERLTA
jgi:hypothetical protein